MWVEKKDWKTVAKKVDCSESWLDCVKDGTKDK